MDGNFAASVFWPGLQPFDPKINRLASRFTVFTDTMKAIEIIFDTMPANFMTF
jgi:hypothetical protein